MVIINLEMKEVTPPCLAGLRLQKDWDRRDAGHQRVEHTVGLGWDAGSNGSVDGG